MGLQKIELDKEFVKKLPSVRIAGQYSGGIGQYIAEHRREIVKGKVTNIDYLTRATQSAAIRFAEKVSNRKIDVDVLIDPMMPANTIDEKWLVSLICELADNASASVEPGPGRVFMKTWFDNNNIGVDVIGIDGSIPAIIRDHIMSPLFTTRTMDWDTGFGLFQAVEDAARYNGKVSLIDEVDGTVFRLSLPLKETVSVNRKAKASRVLERLINDPLKSTDLSNPIMSLAEMLAIYGKINVAEIAQA
ncbi:MAG: ATP-binding protein [Deltaproteobacteria bacterium]|nr:ATP-binding protein [Deltaproteobacteria bacterium]